MDFCPWCHSLDMTERPKLPLSRCKSKTVKARSDRSGISVRLLNERVEGLGERKSRERSLNQAERQG